MIVRDENVILTPVHRAHSFCIPFIISLLNIYSFVGFYAYLVCASFMGDQKTKTYLKSAYEKLIRQLDINMLTNECMQAFAAGRPNE